MFQSTHPHGVRLDLLNNWYQQQVVSIHAPARGATYPTSFLAPNFLSFNPRTRTGCDMECFHLLTKKNYVSIHAPARGATFFHTQRYKTYKFQSTHPHGVRPP